MAHQRHIPLPLLLLLGAALLLTTWSAANAQETPQGYRLGPGDTLSVSVREAPELNTNQPIAEDGTFTLPRSSGRVTLAGLTIEQAKLAITERLERQLRTATVTIRLDETRASSVRLLGAVNEPGTRTIGRTTTLFELLTRADEVKDENGGVVTVRRASAVGLFELVEIPLLPLLQGLEPRYNLPLRNGDLINVPPAQRLTVYFTGELSGAIEFESSEPKTLIRAISKAGGMTERSSDKITITRTNPDGSTRFIQANYKRILNGREPDIALEPGDLIRVKRSII